MTQAEALLRLQELELDIIRRSKRLQEIAATLADDTPVNQAQAKVQAAEEALEPLRRRARDLEAEISSNARKAGASEDELYSGRVKNTKEMQDLQREIASLRQRNTELEETLLDVMMKVEDGERTLAEARAALETVLANRDTERRHLIDEQSALQREVASLREQREETMKAISPENLARYSSLRQSKKYQPVAIMTGNMCSACGVEQTKAIEREVLRGQSLATCLSCGRILVYKSAAT
ncbi:MAG: hypothetical protein DIU68_012165 [Chloroflexota bacterium]|nr:MAG: hypothetical protein DIU68_13815 [Chloroflexota bacterium]